MKIQFFPKKKKEQHAWYSILFLSLSLSLFLSFSTKYILFFLQWNIMHAVLFFFFGKNWIFTYLVCKIKNWIDRQKSKYFAIWFKSSGHWSRYFFFKSTLVHSWKKCSLVLHNFCLSVLNFSEPWKNTVLIWASMFLKSVQVPPPLLQIIIVCLQIIQANSWAAISKTQRSCYRS